MLSRMAIAKGSRRRIRSHTALAWIAGLVCLGLAGCADDDPLARVRQLQATGDYRASLDPLRDLVATRPEGGEVYFRYGLALALTGQSSLAEWSLREAMKDSEWLGPAGLRLAQDALNSANYGTVEEVTNQLLSREPDSTAALLLRAHGRAHSRLEFAGALEDAERILELEPANLDAMEPLILSLLGLERYEEAGQAIEQMGKRIQEADLSDEIRGWHCATSAIFADDSGETAEAGKRFAECTEQYPDHANVVTSAVKFYEAQGQFERAREVLAGAIEGAGAASTSAYRYRQALAERLRITGSSEAAEALLREAAESRDPRVAVMAWVDLRKHFDAEGERAKALVAIEEGVALTRELGDPPAQLLLEYGDALILSGEFERALAVAEDMEVAAHRALIRARVAQLRGEPEAALEHYDETFRLWPDNPWARYQAARVAESTGDFERAFDEYRYAIRIAADATDARTRLARLLLADGKATEALQMLRLQSESHPLEIEGQLLSLRLWAQLGLSGQIAQWMRDPVRGHAAPSVGRVFASIADGTAAGAGAAAAVRMLRGAQGLDLRDPHQSEALHALVRHAHRAGTLEAVALDVRGGAEAAPESATLQAIFGHWLELSGAPASDVRARYQRALELDENEALALLGLARLELTARPDAALELFRRAVAAAPEKSEPRRGEARALVALGRRDEARARLQQALELDAYDWAAAFELAKLSRDLGEHSEEALVMAQRAVRFGGPPESLDLLSALHADRGDTDQAARAADRARTLRARRAAAAPS